MVEIYPLDASSFFLSFFGSTAIEQFKKKITCNQSKMLEKELIIPWYDFNFFGLLKVQTQMPDWKTVRKAL